MKRIIVLLLLATLYSCTNNSQNTNNLKQTLNAKIEKDGDKWVLRNTSQNNKYEFTVSICITDTVDQSNYELNDIITLNPGERNVIGTSEEYQVNCGCEARCFVRDYLQETSYLTAYSTTCGSVIKNYFGNIEYKIVGELNLNTKEK